MSSSTTRASHRCGKNLPMLGKSSRRRSGAPCVVISWQKLSRPYFNMANRSDLLSVRLMTPGMRATAEGPTLCVSPPHDAALEAAAHASAARPSRVGGLGLMAER
jgi:hypothetical protein